MRRGGLSGVGSSPHTRGAPAAGAPLRTTPRIIPAYAGSTTRSWPPAGRVADHPRIRGEHRVDIGDRRLGRGSSPHTRGARSLIGSSFRSIGIIPAYAGSTSGSVSRETSSSDHPRIRGEHFGDPRILRVAHGSSPHTRGAPHSVGERAIALRIIPAYAGSTGLSGDLAPLVQDHPRIRGEHGIDILGRRVAKGSSPHTRGAPHQSLLRPGRPGIIPAYAGSTPDI